MTGSVAASDMSESRQIRQDELQGQHMVTQAKKRKVLDAWDLCGAQCQCGKDACDMAGYIKCPTCANLQKSVCRRSKKCRDALTKRLAAEAATAAAAAAAVPVGSAAGSAAAVPIIAHPM